ncbi:hypothetical protein MASR1M68_16080 [Elusimicrobiota bacterium]
MLVKKIYVMTIVFFMLISNISVSLISLFSFVYNNAKYAVGRNKHKLPVSNSLKILQKIL